MKNRIYKNCSLVSILFGTTLIYLITNMLTGSLVHCHQGIIPMYELECYSNYTKFMNDEQFRKAYVAASQIVEPLQNLTREQQLKEIAIRLRRIAEQNIEYSTSKSHYNDPYGYFILHTASCAGCTRATGLCLNMLGISYEHVNENQWSHQWCRVNVDGTYWICDAFGLYSGPEVRPYKHPHFPDNNEPDITSNDIVISYQEPEEIGTAAVIQKSNSIGRNANTIELNDYSKKNISTGSDKIIATGKINNNIYMLMQMINRERIKNGIHELSLSDDLQKGAGIRAIELVERYSFVRPNGESEFSILSNKYRPKSSAIVVGYSDPVEVFNLLYQSKGNRENILNEKYTEIGIGYYYDRNSYYKNHWAVFYGKPAEPASLNYAKEMLALVNQARIKHGVKPLKLNEELQRGAAIRAQEIMTRYSHTRPNGQKCNTVYNGKYRYSGENIYKGIATVKEAFEGWMRSPGHRSNILNPDYREFGVGYYFNKNTEEMHYWVQSFCK